MIPRICRMQSTWCIVYLLEVTPIICDCILDMYLTYLRGRTMPTIKKAHGHCEMKYRNKMLNVPYFINKHYNWRFRKDFFHIHSLEINNRTVISRLFRICYND
jgi:hypothetical protein